MFSDASLTGLCTVAYAVVNQQKIFSKNLITGKSRLARKKLSTPRLELVAAHISANLAKNVKNCLNKLSVRKIYAWSDSTTVLHWLQDNGEYKTFVSDRVFKTKGKSFIDWKYVPTKENPADLGSRGCETCKLDNKWWEGPKWLQDQTQWPEQPKIENCEESDIERKKIKEILATKLATSENMFDKLLSSIKFDKPSSQ